MLADISTHLTFHLWPTFSHFFRQKPEGFESSLIIIKHLKVGHCELSTVFLVSWIAAVVGEVTDLIHFNASLPIVSNVNTNVSFLLQICVHLPVQFKWYKTSIDSLYLAGSTVKLFLPTFCHWERKTAALKIHLGLGLIFYLLLVLQINNLLLVGNPLK